VYSDDQPLYPNEVIATVVLGNEIYVELLGPKIGMNDPGFTRQKSMWELLAYTPKHEYVEVIFRLDEKFYCPRHEAFDKPKIIGNFGPYTWFRPEVTSRTPEGWVYSTMVPATAEIFFFWIVDEKFVVSTDYEIVDDGAGQQLNCLHAGQAYGNYSELYVPMVDPTMYFKKNDDDSTLVRKVESKKVGKFTGFELTESLLDKMFEIDWTQMDLADVLTTEREMTKAKGKLREFYTEIRDIFRHYARYSSNVAYLNILTFMCFATQCKLPDKHNLKKPRLTEIFHYVNREYERNDENKLVYLHDPLNPDNMFTRSEFMEALCRIALIKYDSQPIDFGITSIMDHHIRKHVEVPDDQVIRNKMLSEPLQRVFLLYDSRLWGIFHKYATIVELDRVLLPTGFQQMLRDHGLISAKFTVRDANGCFLSAQQEEVSDGADDTDLQEMTFSEFLEAMARVAAAVAKPDKDAKIELHEQLQDLLVKLFPQAANNRTAKKVRF
jgi:hypothetical protein